MSSKAVFVNDLKKLHGPTKRELKSRHKKLVLNSSIEKVSKVATSSISGLKKKESLSQINLRCMYTGRKKGLIRQTKMTRMYFKFTAFKGLLNGLRKSSW